MKYEVMGVKRTSRCKVKERKGSIRKNVNDEGEEDVLRRNIMERRR